MQPEIVYAPGAGPRAATSRFGNAIADTTLSSPTAAGAAGDIGIARVELSSQDCDALARVAYAEAGNQGPEGLTAVVYTVLNRVVSGRFQNDIQAVIDARDQFEPVTKAGGWRNLPPLSPDAQAQFNLLLSEIVSGRLPDPTRGALYFQNRAVVAARAAAGVAPLSLVDFGGQLPIAELGDHRFYGATAIGRAVPKESASR
jgi:spore germination cell wall hydrolase CwlJ-like protein